MLTLQHITSYSVSVITTSAMPNGGMVAVRGGVTTMPIPIFESRSRTAKSPCSIFARFIDMLAIESCDLPWICSYSKGIFYTLIRVGKTETDRDE